MQHDIGGARLHRVGSVEPGIHHRHANGKTLCIPSVFIGYHGDALDEKTPLLRSSDILSQKTIELLRPDR